MMTCDIALLITREPEWSDDSPGPVARLRRLAKWPLACGGCSDEPVRGEAYEERNECHGD